MNILVTGASGFIGSELVGQLLDAGHEVIATARTPQTSRPGLTWVEADLSRPGWTARLPEGIRGVAHLAQSRRYREFPEGAKDMYAINLHATFELAEWCREHGVQRFVNAGTGSVYRPSRTPARENDPTEATTLYQATKLAAETILEQYARIFELSCCRIFTVYGPGQRGMLMANMIRAVASGAEITLAQGSGPLISPVHVRDVARAFVRLLEARQVPERINIAGPETSLRACVEHIAAGRNREPNIRLTGEEPLYAAGDDTLFRELVPDALPPESLREVAREEEV